MKKNWLDLVVMVLVAIGALNWGLIGIGNWNVLDIIFGGVQWLLVTVYILIGLAGLYLIYMMAKK